jgi:hypothetical protein
LRRQPPSLTADERQQCRRRAARRSATSHRHRTVASATARTATALALGAKRDTCASWIAAAVPLALSMPCSDAVGDGSDAPSRYRLRPEGAARAQHRAPSRAVAVRHLLRHRGQASLRRPDSRRPCRRRVGGCQCRGHEEFLYDLKGGSLRSPPAARLRAAASGRPCRPPARGGEPPEARGEERARVQRGQLELLPHVAG